MRYIAIHARPPYVIFDENIFRDLRVGKVGVWRPDNGSANVDLGGGGEGGEGQTMGLQMLI